MDQLFKEEGPTLSPDQHHSWLTSLERRFILWGLKERWPATRIAVELGVNEATVRRFRNRYWDEPKLILELDLYEMVGRAKDEEYKCLVCEERVVTQLEMQRHVLVHFLEQDTVDGFLPQLKKRRSNRR